MPELEVLELCHPEHVNHRETKFAGDAVDHLRHPLGIGAHRPEELQVAGIDGVRDDNVDARNLESLQPRPKNPFKALDGSGVTKEIVAARKNCDEVWAQRNRVLNLVVHDVLELAPANRDVRILERVTSIGGVGREQVSEAVGPPASDPMREEEAVAHSLRQRISNGHIRANVHAYRVTSATVNPLSFA
ncbi:unannotated protein [freshwater metagenome]|uniref:Unannotated protein n=1 Tax=freshwater metagenome TaxID=449393 RepID=A0A6J7DCF5_9ZZZZ